MAQMAIDGWGNQFQVAIELDLRHAILELPKTLDRQETLLIAEIPDLDLAIVACSGQDGSLAADDAGIDPRLMAREFPYKLASRNVDEER
jgi:hypothetical protein